MARRGITPEIVVRPACIEKMLDREKARRAAERKAGETRRKARTSRRGLTRAEIHDRKVARAAGRREALLVRSKRTPDPPSRGPKPVENQHPAEAKNGFYG
jgi:hypothetical protein